MYYRYFIKNVFRGGPEAYFKNLVPDIAIFFIATIFAHFLPFVVILCSLLTTVGSWVVGGEMWWAYTLIGLIVPYLAFMLIGNAAVQMLIHYIIYFTPLFIDYKTVAEIARCNMKWISFLFAALTIGSAFQHLESVTATTMLITWIILLKLVSLIITSYIHLKISLLTLTNMRVIKKHIRSTAVSKCMYSYL